MTLTFSESEDRRNQHRDKAQVLLKLAEAVEDSNQRRRKASAVAATVTVDSLQPWAQEWTSQAAAVGKTPPPVPVPVPQQDVDATRMIQATLQSVVTAVYQLREHDHLQYQMLEMKYFDVKRHAFDVEHVNRKLQLQVNNSQRPPPAQQQHQEEEEWTTQLEQENYELRKQLRESCLDCRKLVQENYGLRKILLDAGVQWNVLLNGSRAAQAAGETKRNEDDDDDGSSEVTTEFEDAQEFIPQESTAATALPVLQDMEPEALVVPGVDQEEAIPTTEPVATLNQTHSTMATAPTTPTATEENASSILSTPQRTVSTMSVDSFTTVESTTPVAATATTMEESATRTSSRRRSSRKSVTFAAMASKLKKDRTNVELANSSNSLSSSFSSFQSSAYTSTDHDEEEESIARTNSSGSNTLQPPPTPPTPPLPETKEQQKHDRNLELLGVGGIFAASSAQHHDNDHDYAVRRKSYSNQQHSGSKPALFQKRRNSHQALLVPPPNRQALTAKEFMVKKSSASDLLKKRSSMSNSSSSPADVSTFHIHMSSMARPKSTTTHVVSEPLDPLEEERRLSALLGGFRQGKISSAGTPPATTTGPRKDQEDGSVSKSSSKSIFRRRSLRKSFKSRTEDEDDEDNRSVGSTKSLGRFLKQAMSPSRNKNKNKNKSDRDDRSVGSNVF